MGQGFDTISTVYVNDKIVGETNNQFLRYKFDLKNVLKMGENKVRVAFKAAPTYAKQQFDDFKKKYHYPVLPGIVILV